MNALAALVLVGVLSAPAGPANSIYECVARYPQVDAALKRAEIETGVSRATIWAIAWVETRCDPDPVKPSPAGEIGMFQIIPRDQIKYPQSWFVDRPLAAELRDPVFSAGAAAHILVVNQARYCRGDPICAVRVYNGGTSRCVIGGGRDSRAMPAFAQGNDICARAWRYAIAVSEGMKAVK